MEQVEYRHMNLEDLQRVSRFLCETLDTDEYEEDVLAERFILNVKLQGIIVTQNEEVVGVSALRIYEKKKSTCTGMSLPQTVTQEVDYIAVAERFLNTNMIHMMLKKMLSKEASWTPTVVCDLSKHFKTGIVKVAKSFTKLDFTVVKICRRYWYQSNEVCDECEFNSNGMTNTSLDIYLR